MQLKWLSELDEQLHLAICKEVCSFLGTRTAGYVLEKMCAFHLRWVHKESPELRRDEVLTVYDFLFGNLMRSFGVLIAEPHWAEEITRRGNWQI